jgi:hypothetical protein
MRCCGGVYQTGYLAAMRKAVAESLRSSGEEAAARRIELSPDSPLNTGFLPLRRKAIQTFPSSYAASAVDIAGAGGINSALLDELRNFPANEGMKLSLAFFYEAVIPEEQRQPGWLEALDRKSGIFLP